MLPAPAPETPDVRRSGRATMPPDAYPPVADYALIGDCHSAALVSRHGSIDWCCLPRFDSDSLFGRLLDWERGGHCAIRPRADDCTLSREYHTASLVLVTHWRTADAEARVIDLLPIHRDGDSRSYHQILRLIEGVRGRMAFDVTVSPRFDYGAIKPWIRRHGLHLFTAVGSNNGLVISGGELQQDGRYDLRGSVTVAAGERHRLSIVYVPPENLDEGPASVPSPDELDARLDHTIEWWRSWSERITSADERGVGLLRSAIVLKALTYAPTGAIIAAPTTSLPAGFGGYRAYDYRYSWVRDAAFTVDALVELGFEPEARRFRRFIERSAAGSAHQLQTLYGVDGKRRQDEFVLEGLAGYRGRWPVRIGNEAVHQLQLDIFGELLELSWRWHRRGHVPDDDYWAFVEDLLEAVIEHWEQPDHGIWEMRGDPQHFVHSKVMCWSALDQGIALARECGRDAPLEHWAAARDRIRDRVTACGYDAQRGIFMQTFERRYLDAALLLMPRVGFIAYDDPRMLRTADAVRETLDHGGLIRRYDSPDNLEGEDAAFIVASFWLAECLAHQGRRGDARAVFDRACATANDLGLFAEQFDAGTGSLLGNFPQGLTHLSHISAALALEGRTGRIGSAGKADREGSVSGTNSRRATS